MAVDWRHLLNRLEEMAFEEQRAIRAEVDAAFFKGTPWRSNFLCNLGRGDASKLHAREPRLEFAEACKVL